MSVWPTRCRCGAKLDFSCEDIGTGRPAEGSDYWCSDGDPQKAPHDWGVVIYQDDSRALRPRVVAS